MDKNKSVKNQKELELGKYLESEYVAADLTVASLEFDTCVAGI